jgi:hypothetical protein
MDRPSNNQTTLNFRVADPLNEPPVARTLLPAVMRKLPSPQTQQIPSDPESVIWKVYSPGARLLKVRVTVPRNSLYDPVVCRYNTVLPRFKDHPTSSGNQSCATVILMDRDDVDGTEVGGDGDGRGTGGCGRGTVGDGGTLPEARYRFHWAIIRSRCLVVNRDKQLSSV